MQSPNNTYDPTDIFNRFHRGFSAISLTRNIALRKRTSPRALGRLPYAPILQRKVWIGWRGGMNTEMGRQYPKLLNGMNEELGANQYAEIRYGIKKAKQPFTDYLALVGTIGLEPMTSAM